jgi:hypothetical protein
MRWDSINLTALETGRVQMHTEIMNSKVRERYDEWQRAVRKHDEQLRNARRLQLSPTQIRNMSMGMLLAVDGAFARYKQAKDESEHGTPELLEAALRALQKSAPEGPGSIH